MTRLPSFVLALCTAVLFSSSALAGPAARFVPRAWQGPQGPVGTDVHRSVFALRMTTRWDERVLARAVEETADKLGGDHLAIAAVRLVHPRGVYTIELAREATPARLATLASQLEQDLVGARAYPGLVRATGRAFYDEHLIVSAEPGRLSEVLGQVLRKTDGRLVKHSHVPHTALVAVGAAVDFDALVASAALRKVPGLRAAEPDLLRELQPTATPDDPLFGLQWHLARGAQNADVPGAGEIFADDAWDLTTGDPDVVLAVFDAGTDWQHPDLVDNVRQDLMFDASADDDLDPSPECEASVDGAALAPSCPGATPYRESHGTSVSGVIAARGDNGIGGTGVCPGCSLMPVRLLGAPTTSALTIAEAFVRAVDRGAAAINNSWGPGFSLYFPLSQAERDAFVYARNTGRGGKGTVIIFAAGNDASDVARDAYAKSPLVITVAASTNVDDWATYSNYGHEVDIAAPSQGNIQDGLADDDYGIVTTDVRGNEGYSIDASTFDVDYNPGFSGTSAAAPVVTGLVGLILSQNADLTSDQVRLVLTRTANKIESTVWGEDVAAYFAYDVTGHSVAFGHGRINALAAVTLAGDDVTVGSLGGNCSSPGCAVCSADGRCLTGCTTQDDCPDGSTCNVALGACELPRDRRTDFLALCNDDCAWCTATLDTQFQTVFVCTHECEQDTDCDPGCDDAEDCEVDGFDCRPTADDGPSICAIGDPSAGAPNDFFTCFNFQIGTSIVVVAEGDRELCGDICFADSPGSCPYGMHCADVDEVACECTRSFGGGCRELTCREEPPTSLDESLGFPICVPNPGHGDVCAADRDCQFGDYCAPSGVCRVDDRAGCDVCEACEDSSSCGGRGACVGTNNGTEIGVCAWGCGDGDACPGNSVCQRVPRGGGFIDLCLAPGTPAAGATAQDICVSYSCEVACRDDVPCPDGQVCDDGACVPAAPDAGPTDLDGFNVGGGGTSSCLGCQNAPAGLWALLLVLLARGRRRTESTELSRRTWDESTDLG